MSRRLIFIIGTRAQLIKVAPVVLACERLQLSATLVMTGQHQETMQDLIDEFGIKSAQVAAVEAIERSTIWSLLYWLPAAYKGVKARLKETCISGSDMYVLVHGDTLSTLIGAVAGNCLGAHVVHLESGLTSGKFFDPFPEELCRRIVFHMTDIAICPNDLAANFMRRYRRTVVINTKNNTIADAIALSGASPTGRDLKKPYLLASLHRFHNIYDKSRLHQLVALIEHVSARFPVHFVLHPATRKRLEKQNLLQRLSSAPGIKLSPRMGYRDFLVLAAGAACVLTDGGSNQEELAALGVPTIVMRTQTERPDGLGANAVMEADVPGGVERFIVEEEFQNLRRQPLTMQGAGPSHQIAEFLAHGHTGERVGKR